MSRSLALLLATLATVAAGPAVAGSYGLLRGDGGPVAAPARVATALGLTPDEVVPLGLPIPSDGWHVAGASFSGCSGQPASDLGPVLTSARAQLDDLDSGSAQAALAQAIEGLPCAGTPVDAEELAAALEILGQAAQDESDEDAARAAYRQLIATNPSYALTSAPGTGYEVLWSEVRRKQLALGSVEVSVQHTGTVEVRLDGAAVDASSPAPVFLTSGRHLLQWTSGATTAGAWITLDADAGSAALIEAEALTPLLSAGPRSAGRRVALQRWLTNLAVAGGLDGVAVIQNDAPLTGYRVDVMGDGTAEGWATAPSTPVPTPGTGPGAAIRASGGMRILLGGGWMLADRANYGDITVAAEVRLIGPLHLRIDFDLGISQPLQLPGNDHYDGAVALLPGLGAGLLMRPVKGPIQPFGAFTAGVWITPASYTQATVAAAVAAGASSDDVLALTARRAATVRLFADGGVDLLPEDGSFVLRLSGGVGYGFGFQARAGAQVGFRIGK